MLRAPISPSERHSFSRHYSIPARTSLVLFALLAFISLIAVEATAQIPLLRTKENRPSVPEAAYARWKEANKPLPIRQVAVKLKVGVDPKVFARDFSHFYFQRRGGNLSLLSAPLQQAGSRPPSVLSYRRSNRAIGWHIFRMADAKELPYLLEALKTYPGVVRAEPDYRIRLLVDINPPNDTYWGREELEHLTTVLSGFSSPGPGSRAEIRTYDWSYWTYQWGAGMSNALSGWTVYPGYYYTAEERLLLLNGDPAQNILPEPERLPKVAVIDSGMDYTHPDFNYRTDITDNDSVSADDNDLELSGGQLNMTLARSFANGNTDPDPLLVLDEIGHGTGVAGVIGAAPNNQRGLAGLGFPAQIVPIQVLNLEGGEDSDLVDSITYAVDAGCVVINTSLTIDTTVYPYMLQEAVDYAWNHGALIVSAAGNDGQEGSLAAQTRRYPAACYHVLAVAATTYPSYETFFNSSGFLIGDPPDPLDKDGLNNPPLDPERLASYSNYGYALGVAAPGGDITNYLNGSEFGSEFLNPIQQYNLIWTTAPTYTCLLSDPFNPLGLYAAFGIYGLGYGYLPGTSFAAPHVTGLAALYASKNKITQATPNGPQTLIKAIQRGARGKNGRLDGGFDPNYGYGVIDAEATLNDLNARNATAGGVIGQVTVGGTVVGNVQITARRTNSTKRYSTTTYPDGIFHLVNMPEGSYVISASAFGYSGSQTVNVGAGYDLHGINFRLGPAPEFAVALSPKNPVVPYGGTKQFSAVVNNAPDQSVIWSLPVDLGATISSTGLLTAPTQPGSSQQALVKATSVLDPSRFDTTTVTFQPASLEPIADAFVNSGSASHLNYGGATWLNVKKVTDTKNGMNRCSYLKFDLSKLLFAPKTSILKLYTISPTAPNTSTITVKVNYVADNSWTEMGITANNAPNLNNTTFMSNAPNITSKTVTLESWQYVEIDLTTFIAQHLGETVTLQLINDPKTPVDTNLCFASRDRSIGRPTLLFTYD